MGHDLEDFKNSMPETYWRVFDATSIAEHGAIVERRGGRQVHIEHWRTLPTGLAVLCVVAPDRAGLLSAVAAALARHGLSIVSAQIYTRRAGAEPEAVDFFWVDVSETPGVLTPELMRALEQVTSQALSERR